MTNDDRPAPALPRRALLAAALAAGTAPAWLRHARAADTPRFEQGVASGYPRPDGMVLWTRLTGAGLPERVPVQWELAQDEAFQQVVARGTDTAEAGWAHSIHAEPRGLAPGRWYFYRFTALGQRSRTGRTRTAPALDAWEPLQFAIASCQRYDTGRYAAWAHAAREPLDLVLFLGDYVYEYPWLPWALRPHPGGYARSLDDWRTRYATYQRDPQLQDAHAACPWMPIWDDHEVANDYTGLNGGERGFAARRADAYQAYWEHLPLPQAMRPRRDVPGGALPLHGAHDWGRLARVLLLDGRQHRDTLACPAWNGGARRTTAHDCRALDDPRRSFLGAAQEAWLDGAWATDRPWNLLAQTTLLSRFAWSDPAAGAARTAVWNDGWDGYAPARARLLAGIAARRLPGAVVLGGDLHGHYVADVKANFDDPRSATLASEFVTTSISSPGKDQSRIDAALRFNPHIHLARTQRRGYVRGQLDARRLQMRLMDVLDFADAASPLAVQARYVVESGRPGAQRD